MTDSRPASPPSSPRVRVRRHAERGRYDRATVHAILDEGLVCHVGFVGEHDQPFVIPTAYARWGDLLVLHGSAGSRMVRTLAAGTPACVTVTLLDGVVVARSLFDHSMNYRSVVAIGRARRTVDREEKRRALAALVEHLVPGRSADARPVSEAELDGTEVLLFPLDECSAKVRSGPPCDREADLGLPVWAGVVPLTLVPGRAVADPALTPGTPLPPYLDPYRR